LGACKDAPVVLHDGDTGATSSLTPVPPLRLELLGPMRLFVQGKLVEVPGRVRRSLLARLAIARNDVVVVSTLIDDLWPSDPPEAARRALHTHLSRIRRHLGPHAERLQRSPVGYRLELGEGELDVLDLQAEVRRAHATMATSPDDAVRILRALVDLWRGDALVEFDELTVFSGEAAALAEVRCELVDDLLAAMLAAGDRDAIAEARRATTAQPLRERTHQLLMEALAADGQAVDALRVGRGYSRRLRTTSGLDPGNEFTALEQRIAGDRPLVVAPTRSLTSFVGRRDELVQLASAAAKPGLVTLVGAGGVGKTRLALEFVNSLPESARRGVVALATVSASADVPAAAAAALGVRSNGSTPLTTLLTEVIHINGWLLVLDNCEHVIQAVRDLVVDVLDACPNLTVLTTSRQPLGLAGEVVLRLAPLGLPPRDADLGDLERSAAGQLFLERARHANPGLQVHAGLGPSIAGIVRALDGLPLALELAAGRLNAFSVTDLHDRLGGVSVLLEGGRATNSARHASLRATLEWSYQLLDPHEQGFFCALALFVDGFTLDAAEATGAAIDAHFDPAVSVGRLVDASFLEPVLDTEPARYRMLEPIRAFALTMLEDSGRRPLAVAAHAVWARSLASFIGSCYGGPREAAAVDVLQRELVNLRAVHERACAARDLPTRRALAVGLDLIATYREVPDIHTWAVALVTDDAIDGSEHDPVLCGLAARSAAMQGKIDLAEALAKRSLAQTATDVAALDALSAVMMYRGRMAEAVDILLAAADASPTPADRLTLDACAALAASYRGDHDAARQYNKVGMTIAEECDSDLGRAFGYYVEGEIAAACDSTAVQFYEAALRSAARAKAGFVEGIALVGLASIQRATGRTEDALASYKALIERWRSAGSWTQQWTTLRNLAETIAEVDDHATALTLILAARSAPAAADLTPDAASRLEALALRCEQQLSASDIDHVRALASNASGPDVVTMALTAIDRALGENRPHALAH